MSVHYCWHEFVLVGDQVFLVLSVEQAKALQLVPHDSRLSGYCWKPVPMQGCADECFGIMDRAWH